jgi:4-hydroxybenzoate polyprenyltransferase
MISSITHLNNRFKPYVELMRLEKPAGFLLLMWPCWWGVFLALQTNVQTSLQNISQPNTKTLFFLFLFAIGAIIVRGAGCIINDIADRKIDAQVQRTKNRPLASGALKVWQAILFLILLLLIGLLVFLQLNNFAQILAISAFAIAIIYPFAKRFFAVPQLFLAVCFNSGVLIGYSAITGTLSAAAILIYISGIFWTLAYDTIYAHQDLADDKKLGIKSSAVFFGQNNSKFITIFFSLTVCFLAFAIDINIYNLIALAILAIDFCWQIYRLNLSNAQICLQLFKHNAFISGGLIVLCILAA